MASSLYLQSVAFKWILTWKQLSKQLATPNLFLMLLSSPSIQNAERKKNKREILH